MISIGVRMIYHPPVTVHIVDKCSMSLRPPILAGTICMHNRIIRRVFPRAEHRFGTGHHTHVTRSRPGCPSFCRNHVIISVFPEQFRRFQIHILSFCHPVGRIFPSVVHFAARPGDFQSVFAQGSNPTVVCKQIPFPVFTHHMAWINTFYFQLYRLAPRTTDIVGINHVVFSRRSRIINVITPLIFQ